MGNQIRGMPAAGECDLVTGPLRDCTGVVLAGGRSTRFGRDKADVPWRGWTLLAHVASGLRLVSSQVLAVTRSQQVHQDWPVDQVVFDDPLWPAGPLRGIVTGLAACRSAYALVVSCDTPCVQPALLRALRAAIQPDAVAAVPEWQGHLQPLVAIYRVGALVRFRDLLQAGQQSPRRALAELPHTCLPQQRCREADPLGLSFQNVNSPTDLVALDRLLETSEQSGS